MEIPAYRLRSLLLKYFYHFNAFQGFATRFSVVRGEVVQFKIKTDSSNYRLDIFRVGWFDPVKDFPLKISSGMGVPEQGKWEEWILFHHFNFHRYCESNGLDSHNKNTY